MTVSAVIVGHQDRQATSNMIKKLRPQVDEIILCVCCMDSPVGADITLIDIHRGDWGHTGRAVGLQLATKDYVMFANCDDHYEANYVSTMLQTPADLIYCDFKERGNHFHSSPSVGSITAGNFLIKRELAQGVGWNHRGYEADGKFINDIMSKNPTHHHVTDALYYHS